MNVRQPRVTTGLTSRITYARVCVAVAMMLVCAMTQAQGAKSGGDSVDISSLEGVQFVDTWDYGAHGAIEQIYEVRKGRLVHIERVRSLGDSSAFGENGELNRVGQSIERESAPWELDRWRFYRPEGEPLKWVTISDNKEVLTIWLQRSRETAPRTEKAYRR